MPEKTKEKVDLRGLTCPEPVIRTKKLLDRAETDAVEALVDDDVCVNNLQRLARSLKARFTVEDNNGYFTITLEKAQDETATPAAHNHNQDQSIASAPAKALSASGQSGGTVLFLGKDMLGEGDPDFSRTLMNVFLQTTFQSGLRPRAILLINTGVRLMARDSQTLKVLDDLRQDGCEVLACGLCVEYYKLKDDVPKEQITNMFAICEYLYAADRIIQP